MISTSLPSLVGLAAFILVTCFVVARTTRRHAVPAKGDLHQVGFVWLNDTGSSADRQKIVDAVHEFGRRIPEVKSVAVGMSDGVSDLFSDTSYDVGFILTFENEAARLRYNTHPVHEEAAKTVFLPLSKRLLFYRFVGE